MIAEIITGAIVFVAVVGTAVYSVFANKHVRTTDIKPNASLIEITSMEKKSLTNGYSRGIVKTIILRSNGCYYIEFYPTDEEQGEDIKPAEMQSFVCAKEFVNFSTDGEDSMRRNIVKIIARSSFDLPEKLRDTSEGKWATKEGQLAFIEKIAGQMIRNGDMAIAEAQKTYARGGIAKNTLAQIKEENRLARRLQPPADAPKEGDDK